MGYSQQDKADSHERIVRIAAARFREAGVDGPGVSELMNEAGLTHGGFYRHFDSRDDLVAEAIEYLLAQFEQGLPEVEGNGLGALLDGYLSTNHRDHPGSGCAVAALGRDMATGGDRARSAYTRQVRQYLDLIARMLDGDGTRERAVFTLSALVGAISLARAVNDEELSVEVLDTVRAALDRQPGNGDLSRS
jgi:TetR/AcrR family transcriptional repressor of nem operon